MYITTDCNKVHIHDPMENREHFSHSNPQTQMRCTPLLPHMELYKIINDKEQPNLTVYAQTPTNYQLPLK